MAACRTYEYLFDEVVTACRGEHDGLCLAQTVLATLRALRFVPLVEQSRNDNGHKECEEYGYNGDDVGRCKLFFFKVLFATVGEYLGNGCHTGNHTLIVVAMRKVFYHISLLDASAYGIGEYPLQAVASHETNLASSDNKQYAESVICTLRAYAPRREERVGKLEYVVCLDIVDSNDSHLSQSSCAQRVASCVDCANGLVGENSVGVRGVVRAVGKLHIRNRIERVSSGRCR